MENKIIASLYITKNSTLLVVLEKKEYFYKLIYIKKISKPINLNEQIITQNSNVAIKEIKEILQQFSISHIFVTLGTDYYISTNIPGSVIDRNNFLKLVDLSIKQHYSDKNVADFRIKSIPLHLENQMELVFIISKEIILAIDNIGKILEHQIYDINPAPISAINSYMYNYIDAMPERTMLVQLINNIFEFIIITNKKVIGIEYCADENDISEAIETKIGQIIDDYSIDISSIYFYGDKLNKQNYLKCWQSTMLYDIATNRLNALRLINCDLDKRDKEYCMRMFHIYNSCIGAALPNQLNISVF
ncbi:MAG: hypothetical protein FWG85_03390 [Bacteroidetes bacterium]|nr:hypothetical protein [Bacteroidota bacterium]